MQPAMMRFVGPKSMFEMQGWPSEELPACAGSVPFSAAVRLAGNMMAVPCIGSVIHALLASVPLGHRPSLLTYKHEA